VAGSTAARKPRDDPTSARPAPPPSQTDWAINTATHVYNHNLKGFEVTFDRTLRNIEHRVRILKAS
jgi:hypothetical protein